jgi:hypothetical protein
MPRNKGFGVSSVGRLTGKGSRQGCGSSRRLRQETRESCRLIFGWPSQIGGARCLWLIGGAGIRYVRLLLWLGRINYSCTLRILFPAPVLHYNIVV